VPRGRASGGGERELAGQIGQRLERRASPLIDVRTGLRGQPSAFLDQGQRGVGLQIAGPQLLDGLLQAGGQLGEWIVHRPKVTARLPRIVTTAGKRSAHAVERLVDQPVGVSVLGPGDAADLPAVKATQCGHRLQVQGLHRRMLDLVGAAELLGHKL